MRAFPALCLPPRDPCRNLRTARRALDVNCRDDARPIKRQREARELEERAVLRVWHAEELRGRRRTPRGTQVRVRELAVRWMCEDGGDGGCRACAGRW